MPHDKSHNNNASTDRPAEPIETILAPFQRFLRAQATSGILLLGVTVIALLWANSACAESYHDLSHLKLKIGFGDFALSESLHWWTNDALLGFTMSLFIAGLAFVDEDQLKTAKLAILTASLVAGAGGWLMLRQLTRRAEDRPTGP
jgi:NhaA family Na+:H+ antiporter